MKLKINIYWFRLIAAMLIAALLAGCSKQLKERATWSKTKTLAGTNREFGEPFGLAYKEGNLYVSDGEQGKIRRVSKDGKVETITDKLNTPSTIVFDQQGFLIVADSGSHTIKRINVTNGDISVIAGTENKKGYADGEVGQSLFNAPIGVAVSGDKIYVADTYNDKIRLIENGKVSTVAGGEQGFANGVGIQAKFDTPCGLAIMKDGQIVVADTGNKRLRLIEGNGNVTTLAGTGEPDLIDGFPLETKFVEPTSLIIDNYGAIYVSDGNAIRALGRRVFPFVETLTGTKRGFTDGNLRTSRLNRPSGMAFDENGNLFISDSENQTIRVLTGENIGAEITPDQIKKQRLTPEEFRALQPARWCYNPPEAKRDVAGTLGEVRGEIAEGKNSWFHNGLDIAGSYGETARFVRAEKVLRPETVENFASLRELIRMPTMGYIHIRLGRDSADKPLGDERFQFGFDENHKVKNLRVPRGAKFEAGEAIGTLNRMNHVHLIAGRSGMEMNALDALTFPNISDKIAPTIEKVALFDENWHEISAENPAKNIRLNGKTRIVVRAYDQMDGNGASRRLGVYQLGYQILKTDKIPVTEAKQTISFARFPDESAVKIVYAPGSQSGYSPQTIFDYIVTNEVHDDTFKEDFFEPGSLAAGNYILRVFAADFFGNRTERDLNIEISRN